MTLFQSDHADTRQIQPVPAQRYQSYAGVLLQQSTAALGFLPNASYRVAGSNSLTNFRFPA